MPPRSTELAAGTVRIRDAAPPAPDAPPDAPAAPRRIEGIAVPYGQLIVGLNERGRRERFRPGAFAAEPTRWRDRADGARLAYLDRHAGEPVATVELEDTREGLRFAGDLWDTPAAEAYAARVARGVNGVSIEFDPVRTRRAGEVDEHSEARLFAIAGSYAPAYDGARVAARDHSRGRITTMPPQGFTETLTARLEAHRERRAALMAIAEAEGREASDDELEELESIDLAMPRIEATIGRHRDQASRRSTEASAVDRAFAGGDPIDQAIATTERRSARVSYGPGAFLRDQALARNGSTEARQRLERALADETTTNMIGLVPKAVVGPIIGGMGVRRPLVESATPIGAGSTGMVLVRPSITGGDVDVQATEKTQVTSTAMTATPIETTLATYAGGVDVSWQLIERSSPDALDAIFRRLANRYARRTEIVGAASFVTGASVAPIVTAAGLTAAKVIAAIVQAAAVIAAVDDVDQFPDTVWMSLGTWQTLAALVDTTGRPLFPASGGPNSFGSASASSPNMGNFLGLNPVVVPRFASAQLIVGVKEFLEKYELDGSPVQFRSIEAALLGTNVSVAGLFALKVTNANAFQKITLTA